VFGGDFGTTAKYFGKIYGSRSPLFARRFWFLKKNAKKGSYIKHSTRITKYPARDKLMRNNLLVHFFD
jgi:hypothetical protein